MSFTQVHDYLIVNQASLEPHHQNILAWLKSHSNFLVGLEKYFGMLQDELFDFVNNNHPNAINKELIDDYADKSYFKLLEPKEDKVLSDIKTHMKSCNKRSPHDLVILDYLRELEIQCLFLTKYIRPEFTIA